MNDDVARHLIYDQQDHVVRGEIVGSETVHITFGVCNARPHGEVNDRRDQPLEQVHDEVGAVLPLFRPVHLPKTFEDKEHKNPMLCWSSSGA